MKMLAILSATTLRAVERSLERTIEQWLQDWSLLPIAAVAVQASQAALPSEAAGTITCFGHDKAGGLAIAAEESAWRKLLFPDSAPGDDIAAELVTRARTDLACRVFAALGWQLTPALSDAKDSFHYGSSARCCIAIGEQQLTLLLAPETLKAMPKPKATAVEPLVHKRADAVTAAKASARVTLDLGSLPLTQLQQLAVGDTLVSDTPLTSTFRVELTESVALHAHLGRQQSMKAVYLVKK